MGIQDEESKPNCDRKQIQKLEEDKRIYEEKKKVLQRSINSPEEKSVKIEEIFAMRDEMVQLRHNGKDLKKALDGILSARQLHQEKKKCVVPYTRSKVIRSRCSIM